jgi:hypothetical protein
MKRLVEQIRFLCRVVKHPQTPLDDVLVLYAGMKLITRMVPRSVLAECDHSDKSLDRVSWSGIVFWIECSKEDKSLSPCEPRACVQ